MIHSSSPSSHVWLIYKESWIWQNEKSQFLQDAVTMVIVCSTSVCPREKLTEAHHVLLEQLRESYHKKLYDAKALHQQVNG